MADAVVVEYKAGGYSIAAMSKKSFTFWWGAGAEEHEYFNVSIAPDPNFAGTLVPLIEVQREIGLYEGTDGTPRQTMLILTLQNNNTTAVSFTANHIRVHVVQT